MKELTVEASTRQRHRSMTRGWVNLYKFDSDGGAYATTGPFERREQAYLNRHAFEGFVATIKIEWEEKSQKTIHLILM